MVIDGNILTFPLSIADIEGVLGKPSRTFKRNELGCDFIRIVYDDLGILFEYETGTYGAAKIRLLKTRKVYIDDDHCILTATFYFGNKVMPCYGETKSEAPKKTCKAKLTLEGRRPFFISSHERVGDFSFILWNEHLLEGVDGAFEKIPFPLSASYTPKRIGKPASYKIKKDIENPLHFDNLNFKLAVIQVLMYDLEVLEPYFDIYEFAEQYRGKEIDTESEVIIRPALNFFKKLPIPRDLAPKVEEIYMDGGNEIYMNIIPQWDGEDGCFDLNEVSPEELKQFPNLKKATIMSENFEEVKKVFEAENIEIESL
jgi:hypothetical protein